MSTCTNVSDLTTMWAFKKQK